MAGSVPWYLTSGAGCGNLVGRNVPELSYVVLPSTYTTEVGKLNVSFKNDLLPHQIVKTQ